MKIINDYPPNYKTILEAELPVDTDTIFAYGNTIYNPSKKEIAPDIIYHEHIHSEQQKDPEAWWQQYLYDSLFRGRQEAEAYARQYLWVKDKAPKLAEECLEECAHKLSSPLYKLNLSFYEAKTLIRKTAQKYANG